MKNQILKAALVGALVLAGNSSSVFAVSQTWSNAPISSAWQTAANWVGNGVPGAVNSTTSADIATFNSPISIAGYGGASQPILNDLQRGIRSVRFETADCGAYVFGTSLADNSLEIIHLGDISMSAAVTNPIVFNQGFRYRLPNSTNGRYDFTNNAANPNATMFINTISNSSANTRPMQLFLGGSNTGTNTIARFDDANGGAAGAAGAIVIDKVGTGTWIFSGANDLPQKTSAGVIARVQIIEGTLIVKDVGSLGAITAGNLLITNTGVLQIDGMTPLNLGFGLRHGGTIRMNGTGGVNGVTVGNQVGVNATLRTTSASDVFTVGTVGIGVISAGAADSVLNFNGPGTMVLGTANTYVGRWSFNSGTNQITDATALAAGPNAHIAAGAILDSSALVTYSLTTAAISANGTGTGVGSTAATINAGAGGTFDLGNKSISLTFTPTAFSGDTTHPAIFVSQGSLSLNGNAFTINNASGTPLGAGTYRLIQQASGTVSVSGGPFAIVTGAGLAAGMIGEIQVTGGFVNLVVSAHTPVNLSWRGGNPDGNWDKAITANWFDGVSLVTFGTSDSVTFDSPGLLNPNVNLVETVLPSSVRVDASTNVYTLSGAGQIAGPTSLVKVGTNVLVLSTANSYLGGTTVSNGVLRLGVDNAISSSGSGNVAVYGTGTIDLNNLTNNINGLIGSGTVDNQGGAAGTLSVGNNNSSSTFTGLVQNASGTTTLRKIGTGTLTLPLANTFTGGTVIDGGTLRVDNSLSLAGGAVTINAGTLNVTTNILITGLSGAGGTIVNNSAPAPVTITTDGTGEYTGVIGNGSGVGGIRLFVRSGTTRLNGICTYSNGTIVASGATLALGVINAAVTSGQAGTGGIVASNNASFTLPTAVSTSSALGNGITNIDSGGTLFFTSAQTANNFNGQFIGGANNTNIYSGPMTIGGALSFSNFFGTVVISNGAGVRYFNANAGGDNTTFDVRGGMFSRDANTIRIGALIGVDGSITGPSVSAPATFLIGGKGLSTTFSGAISGSNNIAKVGTGSLVLDGRQYFTNMVTLPDPFEPTNIVAYTLFSNKVTYTGLTTISNNVLRVIAPNNLTNSSTIVLAGGTAILDASSMGYATNQTTTDFFSAEQPTNTVVVTNALVEILPDHGLAGIGSINGSVLAHAGSTLNPGNVTGVLGNGIGTGVLAINNNASLFGAANFRLNRTNAIRADQLSAGSFTIDPGATVVVTNIGDTLRAGDTFTLFNQAVSGFASVVLPATDSTGNIPYVWQNNLAVNGTITVTSGLNTNAPVLTNVVVGNTLDFTWPVDRIGWLLQVQTNSLNVGISSNWFTVANSGTTNHVIVPVVRTNGAVFYRLNLPLP